MQETELGKIESSSGNSGINNITGENSNTTGQPSNTTGQPSNATGATGNTTRISSENVPPWIRNSQSIFGELFAANTVDSKKEEQVERLINDSMAEKSLSEFVEDIKKELMKILKEDEQDRTHHTYGQEIQKANPKLNPKLKEVKTQQDNLYVQEDYNEQTEEEANYLREIERKLKDIQDRLKSTDICSDTKENNLDNHIEGLEIVNRDIQDPDHTKIEEIYKNAQKVSPFKNKAMNISWAKIALSELISLPKLSYEWCTQPFITFSYYKYNHLLLGRDNNLTQYYVGIPDIYHPDRQYILSSERVDKFVCCENKEPQIGEYGYWLIRL